MVQPCVDTGALCVWLCVLSVFADQLVEPRRMAISLDSDIRVEQVRQANSV